MVQWLPGNRSSGLMTKFRLSNLTKTYAGRIRFLLCFIILGKYQSTTDFFEWKKTKKSLDFYIQAL